MIELFGCVVIWTTTTYTLFFIIDTYLYQNKKSDVIARIAIVSP